MHFQYNTYRITKIPLIRTKFTSTWKSLPYCTIPSNQSFAKQITPAHSKPTSDVLQTEFHINFFQCEILLNIGTR